jgi:hypothetical protein
MEWLWLIAPFAVILLLAACGGDDDGDEILP